MSQKAEVFTITDEKLKELMHLAGKAGAEFTLAELKKDKEKEAKAEASRRYKNTKKMLKSYRSEKMELEQEAELTPEEKAYLRWTFVEDLVENPYSYEIKADRVIRHREEKRKELTYSIWRIENALTLYENAVSKYGNEVDKRRYEEMMKMYIYEEPMTIAQIADFYGITERVAYSDIGVATRVVMEYLYGRG